MYNQSVTIQLFIATLIISKMSKARGWIFGPKTFPSTSNITKGTNFLIDAIIDLIWKTNETSFITFY